MVSAPPPPELLVPRVLQTAEAVDKYDGLWAVVASVFAADPVQVGAPVSAGRSGSGQGVQVGYSVQPELLDKLKSENIGHAIFCKVTPGAKILLPGAEIQLTGTRCRLPGHELQLPGDGMQLPS
jgi:hypothetical protein